MHHLLIKTLAHKKHRETENDYYFCKHLSLFCFITFLKCKNSKAGRTQSVAYVLKTVIGLVAVAVIQKEQ